MLLTASRQRPDAGPRIEPFSRRALPAVEGLLAAASLPLDGLEAALGLALVASHEGVVVGFAAVEPYGPAGLLRSVVVAPETRGSGVGRRLVAGAEALAAAHEIRELFLLTETAGGWFSWLGYEAVGRAAVPAAVAASIEFRVACPDSAVAMRKVLRDADNAGL